MTARRTCEELQVGEGLGQHPPTLLLHRQGDHHQTVCQLRKVLNVVVVPEEGEKHREMTEMFSADDSTFFFSLFFGAGVLSSCFPELSHPRLK